MSVFSRRGAPDAGSPARVSYVQRLGIVDWFNGRAAREQVLILIGGATALVYGGFVGVWHPLSALRAAALADISRFEAIAARVSAAGPNLSSVGENGAGQPSATLITDSATAVGLVIRRLEPEGERTRIEIEEADFTVLVDWLSLLEQDHSLRVATIELDRRPAPGLVSARISVED